MKFILIIVLRGHHGDFAINQEFNNLEACQSASNLILQDKLKFHSVPKLYCLAKGKD